MARASVAQIQSMRELARDAAEQMADLADLLPVPADRLEATARICDRLGEDLADLATLLRRAGMAEVPAGQG